MRPHLLQSCYEVRLHGSLLASERDTIRGVQIRAGAVYVYVKAWVGVKFGSNFTNVRLSGNKIARGEAECYLPLNLTHVKFVPEISRLIFQLWF